MTDASNPPEEHIERCAIHAGVPKYKYANGEWYCIWCVSAEAVSQLAECKQQLATLTRQRDRLVEALEAARPFTQVDIRRGPAYPDWEAMNALVSAALEAAKENHGRIS